MRIVPFAVSVACLFMAMAGTAHAIDCGQPDAVSCVEVGSSVSINVTSDLLGLNCVDSEGKPDFERVQLSVSGEPGTGGAGAIFRPDDVIIAHKTSARLFIETGFATKAAAYQIQIKGRGERCGFYPGYQWLVWVIPRIRSHEDVWWFNGARPDGYPDRTLLRADPHDRPPYRWFIREGSRNYLSFKNGKNFIVTDENQVVVIGKFPTEPATEAIVEVTSANSPSSLPSEVRVRAPDRLEPKSSKHYANDDRGYSSVFRFALEDQYGIPIRGPKIPVNLAFQPEHQFFAGNNWVRPPRPHHLERPESVRIWVYPVTEKGKPINAGIPRPEEPHGGNSKVDCWKAGLYVGTEEPGGVKVDTLTLLRYRDHGVVNFSKCRP